MVSSHVRQIPRRVCFWGLYICWTEPWSYCLVHKFLTSSSLISLKDWNSSLIISKHVELGEYSISGILQSSPNTHPKSMNDQFLISYNANGFQQINISLPLAHIYIYIFLYPNIPHLSFPPSYWVTYQKTEKHHHQGRALISEPQQVAPKVHQRGAGRSDLTDGRE